MKEIANVNQLTWTAKESGIQRRILEMGLQCRMQSTFDSSSPIFQMKGIVFVSSIFQMMMTV